MQRDAVSIVVLIIIIIAGIVAGYVTFGILDSQAQVKEPYALSGAIVGVLISWSALGSLFLQLRRSGGELEQLRQENDQLRQKLLKAVSRPIGYDVEVDEARRLVLARPQDWEPGGGVIFDFQVPRALLSDDDIFPGRFTVSFAPIGEDTPPQEEYYTQIKGQFRQGLGLVSFLYARNHSFRR